MMNREEIAAYCIVLKSIPVEIDVGVISSSFLHCQNAIQYNALEAIETWWIVHLRCSDEAEKYIRQRKVLLHLKNNHNVEVTVERCPECIIPDDWLEDDINEDCHYENIKPKQRLGSSESDYQNLQQETPRSKSPDSPDVFDWSTYSNDSVSVFNQSEEHQTNKSSLEISSISSSPQTVSCEEHAIQEHSIPKTQHEEDYENKTFTSKDIHSSQSYSKFVSGKLYPTLQMDSPSLSGGDQTYFQNVNGTSNQPSTERQYMKSEEVNIDVPPPVPKRMPSTLDQHASHKPLPSLNNQNVGTPANLIPTPSALPLEKHVHDVIDSVQPLTQPGISGHGFHSQSLTQNQLGQWKQSGANFEENQKPPAGIPPMVLMPYGGRFPHHPYFPMQGQMYPRPFPPQFVQAAPGMPNFYSQNPDVLMTKPGDTDGNAFVPCTAPPPHYSMPSAATTTVKDDVNEDVQVKNDPIKETKRHTQQQKCSHIHIAWSGSIAQDAIELFFENKRKSGGGKNSVEQYDEHMCEAILKFESPKAVERILEKGDTFKIEGCNVHVSAFDPTKETLWEDKMVLLTGIKDSTTQDCLENFIEVRSNATPKDFLRGEDGKIIISFQEEPDIEKLTSACKKKPLEGCYLDVSRVRKSSSICVAGLDEHISEDSIELLFENKKRTHGGPIRKIEMQKDIGVCIIYFQDIEVAERVYREHPTLNYSSVTFQIKQYYPCLGLPLEMTQLQCGSDSLSITIKDISNHIIKFIKNSKPWRTQLDEILKTHHAQIDWHDVMRASSTMCIKRCHPQETKIAKSEAETWKTKVQNEIEQFLSQLNFEEIPVIEEAWKEVKNYLNTVNIDEADKVGVILLAEFTTIVVVGSQKNVAHLGKVIKQNTTNLEAAVAEKKSHISKKLSVSMFKIHILYHMQFNKTITDSFPHVAVDLKIKEKKVIFSGPLADVNKAQIKMFEIIENLKSKYTPMSKTVLELMNKKMARDFLNEELKLRNVVSAWEMNIESSGLRMYARTMEEVDKALMTLKDLLQEKIFKVKEDFQQFLRRKEWKTLVMNLNSDYSKKMVLEAKETVIWVAATKDVMIELSKQIEEEIENYSRYNSGGTDFLQINSGRVGYTETFLQKEVHHIQDKYRKNNVVISSQTGKSGSGFKITGDKSIMEEVKQELEKLLRDIKEEKFTISRPGATEFFLSEKGENAIKQAERTCKCTIKNVKHSHKKYDDRRGDRSDWENRRHKAPTERAFCKSEDKKCLIKVIEGDMTQLKVDAMVNAANGDLDHCGGLAKALSDAGGFAVQDESTEYVKKHGRVPDGDAVWTGPGALPCKIVIHAVGPVWSGGQQNEEHKLRSALRRSIEIAIKHDIKSIAIPALSAGIFGYPVENATYIIVETLKYLCLTKEVKNSNLSELYLCSNDEKIIGFFIQSLFTIYDRENVFMKEENVPRRGGLKDRSREVHSDQDDVGHNEKYSDKPSLERERKHQTAGTVNGIEIKIVIGELAAVKADVIVNSAHRSLDLSIGATSKSLLRTGGESVQSECKLKYPSGLQPGKVAITKGGNLHCAQIYHGTIQKWVGGRCIETLEEFVLECLKTASLNQLQSIAFPALGTGQLGYPADLVAATLWKCIHQFGQQSTGTSLQKVLLVVFHKDDATIKAFETVRNSFLSTTRGKSRDSGAHNSYDKKEKESFKSTTLGKIEVKVVQGDITQENSDAIVNSTSEQLDLKRGAVSKAILTAAGYSIQKECQSKIEEMKQHGTVVSSGGKLHCKYIIHIKAQRDKESWQKMVTKALQTAEQKKCQIVSFPALGTGGQGCTPEEVAKAIFEATQMFSALHIKTVRVVVFQREMVENFSQVLASFNKGFIAKGTEKVKNFLSRSDNKDNTDGKQRSRSPETSKGEVVFILWSKSLTELNKAKVFLDETLEKEFCKRCIDKYKDAVQKLTEQQERHIRSVGKENKVSVHFDLKRGAVLLQGQREHVLNAQLQITEVLGEIEKNLKETEKAATLTRFVQWQYLIGDKWCKFHPSVNAKLEEAYGDKKTHIMIKDRLGVEYEVDIKKMVECEKRNPSKIYKIQRSDVRQRGSRVVGIPGTWEGIKGDGKMEEVELKVGSKEYDRVSQEFRNSGGSQAIHKIYRVQNAPLYQQFAAKRKAIQERNGKNPEKWLWHGTSANTVTQIINNGFNRSYCGKNGTAYGNGVYFAVNASYSIGYCSADSNGLKHIFSVQVLTGETCQGQSGMTVLPQKSGHQLHETYDSATNSLANPSMYIIFHDSQAYPTYHIVFR